MKKFILAILLTLLITGGNSVAALYVKPEDRVYNKTGTQCVFCCLETLGYAHKIKILYNLTDTNKGPYQVDHLPLFFDKYNVKYRLTDYPDLKYVKEACDLGWGCMVVIYTEDPNMTHAILVTDVTDTSVYVIDNGDPELKERILQREFFKKIWTGVCLLIWNPEFEKVD